MGALPVGGMLPLPLAQQPHAGSGGALLNGLPWSAALHGTVQPAGGGAVAAAAAGRPGAGSYQTPTQLAAALAIHGTPARDVRDVIYMVVLADPARPVRPM